MILKIDRFSEYIRYFSRYNGNLLLIIYHLSRIVDVIAEEDEYD